MTDNITALIAEARAFADRDNGLNWQGRIRELADTLEDAHSRAEQGWALVYIERHNVRLEYERRTAVEDERDRYQAEAESARKTGERILSDALRYRAAIEEIQAMLPGPRTFAESLSRDFEGNLWPRTIDADRVAEILTRALNEGDPDGH